jgi:hypothetical protein
MAAAYLEVEDYIWLDETIQGNVNIAGLVFDDTLEETIDLGPEEVLTVYSDVVEEALDFADQPFDGGGGGSGGGIHWPVISDSITVRELFGASPMRVKQSVLNLALSAPLSPALIAHVHLDVLHGVDVFYEELSSELQIHSTYANAVPYWWEWIYESLDIDMTEPQPLPPIILALYFLENDLVNMRHDVGPDYEFNSKCLDEFFLWDGYVWGWSHLVESPIDSAEAIREIIGKVADDYLYMGDAPVPRVKVLHLIDDRMFIFDAGTHEKYYLLTAADTIAIMEDSVSFRAVSGVGAIIEVLGISEAISTQSVFMRLAVESLTFTDISALHQVFLIEEGLEMGDVDLARWVFNVLAESGCNAADIIG